MRTEKGFSEIFDSKTRVMLNSFDLFWCLLPTRIRKFIHVIHVCFITAIEALMKTENDDLRQACTSALWQIKGEVPTTANNSASTKLKEPPSYSEAISQGASSQTDSPQIMISYQWDSQNRAIEIRDRLSAAGYRVWMDLTNMSKLIHYTCHHEYSWTITMIATRSGWIFPLCTSWFLHLMNIYDV